MAKVKAITAGDRFGRWTALGPSESKLIGARDTPLIYQLCSCDCGTEKWVARHNLTRGRTLSCGCFRDELTSLRSTTHGLSKTRAYNIWNKMRERCENQKDK